MKAKEKKLRVVKVTPRRYRAVGVTEDGEDIAEQVAPAEYAVFKGDEKLAAVVKTGDGWRVCQPTESSKLGMAISPVGMDKFSRVKKWALERFA